jgi:hypothetical protein
MHGVIEIKQNSGGYFLPSLFFVENVLSHSPKNIRVVRAIRELYLKLKTSSH